MRRREFITVLGAAAALPLTAHAQQQVMLVIGYVHLAKPPGNARFNDAFREGLREAGFVENQNVTIEHRWTEERYESLSSILAELVDHRVAAIYVPATRAALEAKAATQSIPVVFLVGSDPVEVGLVASIRIQEET